MLSVRYGIPISNWSNASSQLKQKFKIKVLVLFQLNCYFILQSIFVGKGIPEKGRKILEYEKDVLPE